MTEKGSSPFLGAGMNYGTPRFRSPACALQIQVSGDTALAFSPEAPGDWLHAIRLSDGQTWRGECISVLAPAGQHVLASPKVAPGMVRTYALPSLQPESEIELGAPVVAISGTPQLFAAILGAGQLAIVRPGKILRPPVTEATSLAFSSDGALLAVGLSSGKIEILDTRTGKRVRALSGGRKPIDNVVWRDDGAWIAASSETNAYLWPATGGKARSFFKKPQQVFVLGFCGDLVLGSCFQSTLFAAKIDDLEWAWSEEIDRTAVLRGNRVIALMDRNVREPDPRNFVIQEFDATSGEALRSVCMADAELDYFVRSFFDCTQDKVCVSCNHTEHLFVADLSSGSWLGAPRRFLTSVSLVLIEGDLLLTGHTSGRASVWRRGQPEAIASLSLSGVLDPGETQAMHLSGDTLWVGHRNRLSRFRLSDGACLASREDLPECIHLIVLAGDVLLVSVSEELWDSPRLLLLDSASLEERQELELPFVCSGARVEGARLRLVCDGGSKGVDYDVSAQALGEVYDPDWAFGHVAENGSICCEIDTPIQPGEKHSFLSSAEPGTGRLLEEHEIEPVTGNDALDTEGRRLAAPHAGGRVGLWCPRTGRLLSMLDLGVEVAGVRWFPGEDTLLVWSSGGSLREVQVPRFPDA